MQLPLRASASTCLKTRYTTCEFIAYGSIRNSRSFSSSARLQTRQRRSMWMWLQSQGRNFLDPLPGSTNYLGAYNLTTGRLKRASENATEEDSESSNQDTSPNKSSDRDVRLPPARPSDLMPFPLNQSFRSQPVVNEAMREAIWEKIMKEGLSVSTVSSQLGVEMSRVGAIVRLKEVEKEWVAKGKRLARPYAKAVMEMLPQTPYPQDKKARTPQPHESINDLPVHAATMQQIFHPTSESRHFTRVDAAEVFDKTLLPADRRVPHPELADLERDRLAGMSIKDRVEKAAKRSEAAQQKKLEAEQRRLETEKKAVKIIRGTRWDFKFREISVDAAGSNGRGREGTGWRYGVPHMDRRKGEVKIPTRVE